MKNLKLHNKYDVFTKIKKILTSCKTIEQMKCTRVLLDNFEKYYKDAYLSKLLIEVDWKTHDKILDNKKYFNFLDDKN
ncbi:hypothetical protein J6O48_14085 [bacterium]|nr:hypothetical protein [bacterium]